MNNTLKQQGNLIQELTRENHKWMERLHTCTLDYIKLLEIPRYFEAAGLSKKSLLSKSPKTDLVSMDSKDAVLEIGHAKKTYAKNFLMD